METTEAHETRAAKYTLCTSMDQWRHVLRMASSATVVAYDYEQRPCDVVTHDKGALRPEQGAQICGVALAFRVDGVVHSAYCPIRHSRLYSNTRQCDAREALALWSDVRHRSRKIRRIEGGKVTWVPEIPFDSPTNIVHLVAHNITNELAFDLASGVSWVNVPQIHDTKIAARVTGAGVGPRETIGLKQLRDAYLAAHRFNATKDDLDKWLIMHGFKPGQDIHYAPPEIAGPYAADDAVSTLLLFERWMSQVVRTESTDTDGALGWWWQRGHAVHHGGRSCVDLYELEIAAAVASVLCTQRGSCYDLTLAQQRSTAAEIAQTHVTTWIQRHIGIPDFNPASDTDVKKYVHGEAGLMLPVNKSYLTDSFKELPRKEQEKLLTHEDSSVLLPYASASAAALDAHAKEYPQHRMLLSAIAAVKKMTTVLTWCRGYAEKWVQVKPDHYWLDGVMMGSGEAFESRGTDAYIYHQLNTVGALSGRMTSSDPNGQNAVADDKLVLQMVTCDTCDTVSSVKEIQSGKCSKCGSASLRNIVDRCVTEVADAASVARWNEVAERDGLSLVFGVRRVFTTRQVPHAPQLSQVLRPIDLSQIEVRRFAWRSGNKLLLKGYGAAPTCQQIQWELAALRDYGALGNDGLQRYLSAPALDPYRHWTSRNLDAHSLMSCITTPDSMAAYGIDGDTFHDVMQLVANAEDEALEKLVTLKHGDRGAAKALLKQLKQLRKSVKGVTFGVLYGMGVASLSVAIARSVAETEEFLENQYYARLPEAKGMAKQIGERAIARFVKGGSAYVFNSYGRKFLLDPVWFCWDRCSANGKSASKATPCNRCRMGLNGEYVLPNRLIQGDAAGDFKMGYVRVNELLRMPSLGGGSIDPITNLPMQEGFVDRPIHDENVISLPRWCDTAATDWALRGCMTLIGDRENRNVPLATSSERCTDSWADKVPVSYDRFGVGKW